MIDNIFIPKKIKIGFQKRSDTYTQKLAYVIYYDEKNKLRKEQSWNSWRDKKINPLDFDNVPTTGFVLNKKVGGCKYNWNVRNTYVRIYDPRDFEFEITIPNLLFILENTNCIKGKGLEGDFVYGWSHSELLLIPTSSPQYTELSKLNDLRHNKNHTKSKDLILGATYLHKSNVPMIYMGKFNKYLYQKWTTQQDCKLLSKSLGEHFYFIEDSTTRNEIKTFKSLSDYFIEVIDNNCTVDYAKLMRILEKSPIFSPINKIEYIEYTLPEFTKIFIKNNFFYTVIYIKINDSYIDAQLSKDTNGKICCWTYNRNYSYRDTPQYFDSIEKLFDNIKPCYQNTYLANGKLFETTKKGDQS